MFVTAHQATANNRKRAVIASWKTLATYYRQQDYYTRHSDTCGQLANA